MKQVEYYIYNDATEKKNQAKRRGLHTETYTEWNFCYPCQMPRTGNGMFFLQFHKIATTEDETWDRALSKINGRSVARSQTYRSWIRLCIDNRRPSKCYTL